MKKLMSNVIIIISILILSSSVQAHTTSTSYLSLDLIKNSITGMWKITLKDLHLVMNLDLNNDSRLIWSEILSQEQKIVSELNKSVSLYSDNMQCKLNIKKLMIDRSKSNIYLDVPFTTNCNSSLKLKLNYNFLFDQDAFHKTILSINRNNKTSTNILSYSNRVYNYSENTNSFYQFFEFVVQGIIHVLIGLDHVLFVICLLLSATLLASQNNNNKIKPLINNTLKLITAFTIAHSITLILASTKILSIPPSIIEPIIALSVIVLALVNLLNTQNIKHWPIVFIFGLIHGFGFAFVLEEVPVQSGTLITSLFGFNIGVEFGQLLIVVIILPVLYFLYSKKYYQRLLIPVMSVFIATIGLLWFIERTLNITII
jgi:hydrogenase/urease accessory protein HupE